MVFIALCYRSIYINIQIKSLNYTQFSEIQIVQNAKKKKIQIFFLNTNMSENILRSLLCYRITHALIR